MELLEESKMEASKITRYLLSTSLEEKEACLYANAIKKMDVSLDANERKIFEIMLSSNWKMAVIDAALALRNPQSVIRKRLFVMLSILETSPNYTDYFLSKRNTVKDYVLVCFSGIRSIIRGLIGIFILKIINLNIG